MKLSDFKKALAQHPDKTLNFLLPTGTKIPVHAHVTDVARMEKRFIDCGGTFRTEVTCRLQTWFADDTEHRVGAKMLFKVLEKSMAFLESEDLEVEIEYEAPFISYFPVTSIEPDGANLLVQLGIKHTTCLAQDICVPPPRKSDASLFKVLPTLETAKCC